MSALDELATYLGNPDRPYDAHALELLAAALEERRTGIPPRGHMGDNLDVPFDDAEPGTTIDIDDSVLTGGLIVAGAAVPVPGIGTCPALVYRFARYDGHILRPVVLVLDDDQMAKIPALIADAAAAARRVAAA